MKSLALPPLISILTLSVVSLFASFAMAGSAGAGEYSVQIGAFSKAPTGFAEAATAIGPLKTSKNANGLTRYQIGSFGSEAAAQTARTALIGAGYSDAFVVQKGVARRSSKTATTTAKTNTSTSTSATGSGYSSAHVTTPRSFQGSDALVGLPESIRSRVVVLDGAYYVKDGDRFLPLSQALANEK